jgi:hypothetical protein
LRNSQCGERKVEKSSYYVLRTAKPWYRMLNKTDCSCPPESQFRERDIEPNIPERPAK